MTLLTNVPDSIRKLSEVSGPPKIVALFTMFLAPLSFFFQIVIFFLFVDMCTSIWAQYKVLKKERADEKIIQKGCLVVLIKLLWNVIDLDRWTKTIEKILAYIIALMMVFIFDHYVLRIGLDHEGNLQLMSATNAVYALILTRETISIMRNLGEITDDKFFNAVVKILSRKSQNGDLVEEITAKN